MSTTPTGTSAPSNWPPDTNAIRTALGYTVHDGDDAELKLYMRAACELIDKLTGRETDPTAHLLANGDVPAVFVLAARETAKLWWQQSFNGPRGGPTDGSQYPNGVPMGAELPRRVQAWLETYMLPVFS